MNVTCFTIIWDTIKHMTNIKLLELNDFCGTLIFLLDIYMPNAYREIITLSVYTGLVLVEKKTNNSLASCNIKRSAYYLLIKQTKIALLTNNNCKVHDPNDAAQQKHKCTLVGRNSSIYLILAAIAIVLYQMYLLLFLLQITNDP